MNEPVSIAGFGGRRDRPNVPRTDSVFVAASGEHHYVIDIATSQIHRVPVAIAQFVEDVLVSGPNEVTGSHVSAVFGALGLGHVLISDRKAVVV
jgi:hypothetical protein